MVLLKIPDGKAKDMGITGKVDLMKGGGAADLEAKRAAKKAQKSAQGAGEAAAEKKEKPAAAAPAAGAPAKGGDVVIDEAKVKAKAAAAKPGEREIEDVTRLNIIVGRIKKVWEHPEADKLWCEEIDCGEAEPRQIASGLRNYLKQ